MMVQVIQTGGHDRRDSADSKKKRNAESRLSEAACCKCLIILKTTTSNWTARTATLSMFTKKECGQNNGHSRKALTPSDLQM